MFGLTRREQRWKAEQQALEALTPLLVAKVKADARIEVAEAEAKAKADEVSQLRAEVAELRAMLLAQQPTSKAKPLPIPTNPQPLEWVSTFGSKKGD